MPYDETTDREQKYITGKIEPSVVNAISALYPSPDSALAGVLCTTEPGRRSSIITTSLRVAHINARELTPIHMRLVWHL